jgi:hypothetical protein
MDQLLSNMYVFQCSVPENVKFIYDLELNCNYLEELNEQIYNSIRRIPYTLINVINQQINPSNSVSTNDIFITFKMNQVDKSVEIITQSEYVKGENFPFHFNLVEDGLLCDFVDPTTLETKLMNSPKRYLAWDVDFISSIRKSGHSIILIFDTKTKTGYLLDSNGTLDYFNHQELGIYFTDLIHQTMEFYLGLLGYTYIKLDDVNIKFKSNYKILLISKNYFSMDIVKAGLCFSNICY